MDMQFGFQTALHDTAASLAISQDGPCLIIEEVDAPPSTVSFIAGVAFALSFVAFGLFVASWELEPASQPLRFPIAGLFTLVGAGLLWLAVSRKKSIRRLIANCDTQTVEYGHMVAGKKDSWQYRKKGVFDYHQTDRFNTGYVDHTEIGAELTYTGLYVRAPDGPRGGLLVMGALYEVEIAVDYIYRHMNETARRESNFGDDANSLPRSFVPLNRDRS
ncbi:hypothetical protein [Sphingorhabdus sp. Alg231-15]|uniref:hypothetical protein n=1 Tax=Sphingorhabdus sp. Alg231-15 TaxID=1922222 RepID=UPI000D54FE3A